jgi:hypothetical protein
VNRLAVVVLPHEREHARRLFGKEVFVVALGEAIVGRHFNLILRTFHPTTSGSRDGEWERRNLRTRMSADCRLVVADLPSLFAIFGAIQTAAPWILSGAPPRVTPA